MQLNLKYLYNPYAKYPSQKKLNQLVRAMQTNMALIVTMNKQLKPVSTINYNDPYLNGSLLEITVLLYRMLNTQIKQQCSASSAQERHWIHQNFEQQFLKTLKKAAV